MCANFKPLTLEQLHNLGLPEIPFEYPEEVYPNYATPLLFHSAQGLEWRPVNFGLIPKWAEDKTIGTKTYNARNETLLQRPWPMRPSSVYPVQYVPQTSIEALLLPHNWILV